MTKKVVLVTGGTGLVGNGIRIAHERDPRDDETFVFLSSKDADLTDKESTRKVNKGFKLSFTAVRRQVWTRNFGKSLWFFRMVRLVYSGKNFKGGIIL